MRTIRLTLRTAEEFLAIEAPNDDAPLKRAFQELRSAVARARSPKRTAARKATRARKSEKAKTKKEARAEVRAAVIERAGGRCEACGSDASFLSGGLQLDHFRGRSRAESVESCWALCDNCHRYKTRNDPSAAQWLRAFEHHCRGYGYATEADKALRRLAFVEARKGQAHG